MIKLFMEMAMDPCENLCMYCPMDDYIYYTRQYDEVPNTMLSCAKHPYNELHDNYKATMPYARDVMYKSCGWAYMMYLSDLALADVSVTYRVNVAKSGIEDNDMLAEGYITIKAKDLLEDTTMVINNKIFDLFKGWTKITSLPDSYNRTHDYYFALEHVSHKEAIKCVRDSCPEGKIVCRSNDLFKYTPTLSRYLTSDIEVGAGVVKATILNYTIKYGRRIHRGGHVYVGEISNI